MYLFVLIRDIGIAVFVKIIGITVTVAIDGFIVRGEIGLVDRDRRLVLFMGDVFIGVDVHRWGGVHARFAGRTFRDACGGGHIILLRR